MISLSVRNNEDNYCSFRALHNNKLRIIWEITRRCNLNCKHCFIPTNMEVDLKTDEMFSIVDNWGDVEIGKIALTGGEPFLRKDIFKLLEYLRLRYPNVVLDICTNGTLLTEEKIIMLKSMGVNEMTISIDGLNEIHDIQRNKKGSFEATFNNIKLLIKNNIAVDCVCVVNKINFETISETINLAYKNGVSSITIANLINLDCSLYDYDSIKLNDDEVKFVINEIRKKRIEVNSDFSIRTVAFNQYKKNDICNINNIVSIDSKGSAFRCLTSKNNNTEGYDLRKHKLEGALKLLNSPCLCN